jgi:hypothetical protein
VKPVIKVNIGKNNNTTMYKELDMTIKNTKYSLATRGNAPRRNNRKPA